MTRLRACYGACTPLVIGALVSGCSVGPDFHRPVAPNDTNYAKSPPTTAGEAETGQTFHADGLVSRQWWKLFGSPALDSAVERALESNPSLESAKANLARSQDLLRAGYGVFIPQVDAKAGASRQLSNAAPGVLPSSTYNLYTVSGAISYTLDIWGGGRRQVEALGAAVDVQRYSLAGAYVMLAGNVVSAVISEAAYRAEIDATNHTIELLRGQVRIARAQVEAGTAPHSTVLGMESQLASALATLPPLERKIDEAENLLAALSGLTPAHWKTLNVPIADLKVPRDLPVSLPSTLVRQRPDVLVAEALLHAANANIGVATAAMLPNITLTGNLGLNATSLSEASPLWGFGAGLLQPIFHGGALYYQRKAAIDAREAAAADYRQTVISAFQQVANTLSGLVHDADGIKAEEGAVDAAERALNILQSNYQAGVATYLQVLIADGQYQQAKIAYVAAEAQRLEDTVALFVALGGGYVDPESAGAAHQTTTAVRPDR